MVCQIYGMGDEFWECFELGYVAFVVLTFTLYLNFCSSPLLILLLYEVLECCMLDNITQHDKIMRFWWSLFMILGRYGAIFSILKNKDVIQVE